MSQEDSKIEQLKKKLYSQQDNLPPPHRGRLHPHNTMVNSSWETPTDQAVPKVDIEESGYKGLGSGTLKKIFIFALLFFILAAGVGGYIFYKGGNLVSDNKIDIHLIGPVSSPAGEELSLDVDVTNSNNSDIELADLIMTFPEGTREAGDKQTSMTSARIPVGTIHSGETVRQTVKAILFGEENVKKNIKATLEYRVPGSDTIFVKEKDFPIFIGNSPITLHVETLKELTANQEAVFDITLKSNTTSVVKGVVLKADYPFGFKYNSATVDPIAGNNVWTLGDISPGETRKITIRGKIVGDDNEVRVFKFYTGTEDPRDSTALGTIFVNTAAEIAVRKPFLGADIAIEGSNAQTYVVTAGTLTKGEITWQNNLDVPINDVVIEAKLTGSMLDKSSVEADSGFYRSTDNTLIWDNSTIEDLRQINPGETGRVQFSLASLPGTTQTSSQYRRPVINLELTIRGKRLNEERVSEEIKSSVSREIKVASGLTMTPILVRNIGPFQNSGPFPPKAEQETTYTVIVTVSNSFNNVKGATYTAVLPPYVRWMNKVNPSDGAFSYNADKREVTVSLGDISAGVGYNSAVKQFAYQVGLTPSVNQIDQSPVILISQKLSGTDTFANATVQDTYGAVDTKIEHDPTYQYGQEKVQP